MASPRVEDNVPVQAVQGEESREEGKKTEGSLKGRICRVLQSMKEMGKNGWQKVKPFLETAGTVGIVCLAITALVGFAIAPTALAMATGNPFLVGLAVVGTVGGIVFGSKKFFEYALSGCGPRVPS